MNLAKHCALCENQMVSLQSGTTCALTEKKPEFNTTCAKIQFGDKLYERIKSILIEYESVKHARPDVIFTLLFYLFISSAIMCAGVLLGRYVLASGVISTVPLIIMGVGFLTLPMAFGPLNSYRRNLSLAQRKKDNLEDLLKKYKIKYTFDIHFKKKMFTPLEAYIDLKITDHTSIPE